MDCIKNFVKYNPLLKQLVIRDIKVKYRSSILGVLWSVLNPLLSMIVITIVFSQLFRYSIDNFPVYLMCGNLVFQFFSESTSMSMTSIIGGAELIKKVYIPKYIFPLARNLSSFVNLLFSLIAIIIIMIITKVQVTWAILLMPIILILLLIFTTGFSLILSSYTVFFRDIIHLYSVLIMILMYLTPLFYPEEIIPDKFKIFLYANPLYYFVKAFRCTVLYGQLPSLKLILACILLAISAIVLGIFIFYKKQDKFILHV